MSDISLRVKANKTMHIMKRIFVPTTECSNINRITLIILRFAIGNNVISLDSSNFQSWPWGDLWVSQIWWLNLFTSSHLICSVSFLIWYVYKTKVQNSKYSWSSFSNQKQPLERTFSLFYFWGCSLLGFFVFSFRNSWFLSELSLLRLWVPGAAVCQGQLDVSPCITGSFGTLFRKNTRWCSKGSGAMEPAALTGDFIISPSVWWCRIGLLLLLKNSERCRRDKSEHKLTM